MAIACCIVELLDQVQSILGVFVRLVDENPQVRRELNWAAEDARKASTGATPVADSTEIDKALQSTDAQWERIRTEARAFVSEGITEEEAVVKYLSTEEGVAAYGRFVAE